MGRYLELVRSAGQKPLAQHARNNGANSELSPPYFAYSPNSQTPPLKNESDIDESASCKLVNDFSLPRSPIQSGGKGACELSELSEISPLKAALAAVVASRPEKVLNSRY